MRFDDDRLNEDFDSYSFLLEYIDKETNIKYGIMNYGYQSLYNWKSNFGPYFWLQKGKNQPVTSYDVFKIYMDRPEYVRVSRRDVNHYLTKRDLELMINFFTSMPTESNCYERDSITINAIREKKVHSGWELLIYKNNEENLEILIPPHYPMPYYSKLPTKSF